jgi:hypothetical protein
MTRRYASHSNDPQTDYLPTRDPQTHDYGLAA